MCLWPKGHNIMIYYVFQGRKMVSRIKDGFLGLSGHGNKEKLDYNN